MVAIKLHGDRVAGNNSIIARPDGSFFDFNGSRNYQNLNELLKAEPDLTIAPGFSTPYANHTGYKKSRHDAARVTKVARYFKEYQQVAIRALDSYLPFYNYGKILSNLGATPDGALTVFWWKPSVGGSVPGQHYSLCQIRGTDPKWRSIKGSDSKTVEIGIFCDDDPVYCVFGAGDFLLLKSTGLNYMGFGGDGAAKNTLYVSYIMSKIGTRVVRLIPDYDESGRKTASYLSKIGLRVEVFDWNLLKKAENKMDLRDLAWQLKDLGGDINTLKNLITQGDLYE